MNAEVGHPEPVHPELVEGWRDGERIPFTHLLFLKIVIVTTVQQIKAR